MKLSEMAIDDLQPACRFAATNSRLEIEGQDVDPYPTMVNAGASQTIARVVAVYGLLLNLLLLPLHAPAMTATASAANGALAHYVLCLSDPAGQSEDPSNESKLPAICPICATAALVALPAAPTAITEPLAVDTETRPSPTHVPARIAVAGPRNRGPPSA